MAKTIEQLKAQGAEVKNATVVGENTATRVGTLFNDIVEHVEEYEVRQTADTEANTQAIAKRGIYDVSAYNDGAVFKSLSALLNHDDLSTLIPESVRCGGMSIRFIQGSVPNSDNKYVQYFLSTNEWSIDPNNWEKMNLGVEVLGKENQILSGSKQTSTGSTFTITFNESTGLPSITSGCSFFVKVSKSASNVISQWRMQFLSDGGSIGYSEYFTVFDEWVKITNTFQSTATTLRLSVGSSYIGAVGTVSIIGKTVLVGLSERVTTLESKTQYLDRILTTKKYGHVIARNISLASGDEYAMDFRQFISKNMNIGFACNIDNSFNAVEVGTIGLAASGNALADATKKYETRIVVDVTNITIYIKDYYSNYIEEVVPHGLILHDALTISIKENDRNQIKVSLGCDGQLFETTQSYENWHLYKPYCKAVGCSITNGELSFSCSDFNKNILFIGDSYLRYVNTRWPYYMIEDGYGENCILCAHSGAKTQYEGEIALNELVKIISPKYIVWCLGMNDLEDGTNYADHDGQINSKWADGRDHLIQVCNEQNITPVFATIPSAYDRNHEAKDQWIRQSGYLYIDFAKAVGAHIENGLGVWREGLRENETNGIHPSALGAKVMWQQLLIDFPIILCD